MSGAHRPPPPPAAAGGGDGVVTHWSFWRTEPQLNTAWALGTLGMLREGLRGEEAGSHIDCALRRARARERKGVRVCLDPYLGEGRGCGLAIALGGPLLGTPMRGGR